MARHSSYKDEYADQAEKLCKLGATDKEIADFFGIAESTLNLWKKDFPEFSESLKKGKLIADSKVADSLYHRANGYSHPETHVSNYQGEITLTELTKHYPPDSTACIFWLKNRRSDQWRDKTEREVTIKKSAEEMSDDELTRIARGSSNRAVKAKGSKKEATSVH